MDAPSAARAREIQAFVEDVILRAQHSFTEQLAAGARCPLCGARHERAAGESHAPLPTRNAVLPSDPS